MSALLRLVSLICSLVLIASFAMFASDEARHGSKEQVAQISSADASSGPPAPAKAKKQKHGAVRTAIDGANGKLVAPFDAVVASDSPWVKHIVPGLLAFLVFGLGIGFVARYAATRGV